jgi:hypothetical protein
MSFPFPQAQNVSTNPIENIITSVNSNSYFIGSMMLLLNLGGRFIGMEVSKEQEKFFQEHDLIKDQLSIVEHIYVIHHY